MKAKFYEGERWKGELENVLMPMMEEYEVVLVEDNEDLIADDPSIAGKDIPVGVCRDVGFMGHDDAGDTPQPIELLKNCHDFDTGVRIPSMVSAERILLMRNARQAI